MKPENATAVKLLSAAPAKMQRENCKPANRCMVSINTIQQKPVSNDGAGEKSTLNKTDPIDVDLSEKIWNEVQNPDERRKTDRRNTARAVERDCQ